jgi:hypothetical protein
MRPNLMLALIMVILGFLLFLLSFVFLNIRTSIEPFATWSTLPYAGMFQYAGLVCLVAAIICLWLETRETVD